MKKPNAAAIRASAPLSVVPIDADRLAVCSICGRPCDQLGAWRAHDERDQPIDGERALVFIGADHAACNKKMQAHPRLFAEVTGRPGNFPLICGPCVHRDGLGCNHGDAKSNGGAGLLVHLSNGPLENAIICSRSGCYTPVRRALRCDGFKGKD